MSSLNLKVRVKNGEIAPKDALVLMVKTSLDYQAAINSRTGRWLTSNNAIKRYKQAVNARNVAKASKKS